ncbi:hypothetical protein PHYPO_G00131960 [Pangasianodon hypophthalmus]|uniref:Uncharacterized protein n=1 Tax=Pangasianodon hypophthalmus TaxID=310915 RepID=A0A5N5KJV9_PANHP|nr:hypothetical protein PHYPO_G00131960 [Pangasianodon hypophthalmus]
MAVGEAEATCALERSGWSSASESAERPECDQEGKLRGDYSRCCGDMQPQHGFLLSAVLSVPRLGGVSEGRRFGVSEGPGTLERTMLQTGFTTGSDVLRLLRNDNTTTPANTTEIPNPAPPGAKIVEIVVPIVVILVLILIGVLVFLFCVVKKKRQTEGTYRPSAEEQTGTRSVEAPNALKLPKEERLI